MSYPGIEFATKEMAYDNGCINRERSEEDLIRGLYNWLSEKEDGMHRVEEIVLREIDTWLSSLTEPQMHLLCAGEESEQESILDLAPESFRGRGRAADLLLTWIFEEVL